LVFEVPAEDLGFEQKVTKETKGVRREQRISDLKLEISEDFRSFVFGEFAPLAGGEVGGEMELADGDAEEAEGGVGDGGGHFADLAVAAFLEGEFEPAGGDVQADADRGIAGGDEEGCGSGRDGRAARAPWFWVDAGGLGGEGLAAFDEDAGAELLEGGLGEFAFDLGPVSAGVGVFGVEEMGVESGLVGEKEEAFAVAVEAAERVDGFREAEFGQGALSGVVGGELGEDAVGFVQC
jgi:hypothetical protein